MANTAGDWQIARHITALLELLEANPEFSKSFIDGDGRIGITRLGYTFETFEDRPTTFFAAPPPHPQPPQEPASDPLPWLSPTLPQPTQLIPPGHVVAL